ncbi:peptidase M28-like protein [Sphingomonas sp. F9_3S_D5_B_2]
MRTFALVLSSVALIGAGAPPSPDAKLRSIVAAVSQAQLRHTIATLVSFGTRHTLSSQTDPKRGIGAALEWTRGEFQRDSVICGNCLTIVDPAQTFTGSRIPTPTRVRDMVAIQRGTERPNDVVIIQGHIDSRVTDVMNVTSDAPGANDDGSGVAAVLEAARVLSKHRFPGTIVYAALSGEEQGLYGGKVLADYAKAQGWNVVTVLNNDIVGNSCSSDGVCDSTHARVLSEGPRSQGQEALAAATHSLGGENDAPSRNISRFLDSLADRLNIGLDVRQIWRTDRFGRGGDHIPFLELGYPAARISVAVENYNWQHQDLRTENGVRYGDTIDHVDFPYLAKMTKLNVAALAAIASAPPPPAPRVEGAVSTDTAVKWSTPKLDARYIGSYVVRWRRTDAANWQYSKVVPATGRLINDGPRAGVFCYNDWDRDAEPDPFDCAVVLPHVRVDDWVFGVSSVSKDGFESPVASAVPGGAFKPYVAPAKKP